jgi:3-deoxy-D-manno-octulosonic acid kinase
MDGHRLDDRQLAAHGYVAERLAGARLVARANVVAFVMEALRTRRTLYDYAAGHREAETFRGRAPVYVVPGPESGRWVVRHLTHGGLLAPLSGDRFLRLGTPRPFNELRLSLALEELGIPTPGVAAAVVYPSFLRYRGEVARDEIPNATDLAACLFGEPVWDRERRLDALAAAGGLIRALHRAGVVHPDLNLRNVLVRWAAGRTTSYILDVEKCRIMNRVSERRRRAMLRRFRRSARKFEERSGRALSDAEWEAFWTAYAEGPPADDRT